MDVSSWVLAIVTSLLSGLAVALVTLRWQERRQWQSARGTLYARFLGAATKQHDLGLMVTSIMEREQHGAIVADRFAAAEMARQVLADRGEQWEQSEAAMLLASSEIRLLGGSDVVKAAAHLLAATRAANPIWAADHTLGADDETAFDAARIAFEAAARGELKVQA